MRENRLSGSEGGEAEPNRPFLPLSHKAEQPVGDSAEVLPGVACRGGLPVPVPPSSFFLPRPNVRGRSSSCRPR
jgi:hypothetical protein